MMSSTQIAALISQQNQFLVYGLVDPETRQLRYVGKSTSGTKRPKCHMCHSCLRAGTHKARWLRQLVEKGLRPEIVILATCLDHEDLMEKEASLIQHYRRVGYPLTNSSDGWGGTARARNSEEVRRKISIGNTGKTVSTESRLRISLSHGGRPIRDIENGTIYASVAEAADVLAIRRSGIHNMLAGRQKRVEGYRFEWVESQS